MQNGWHLMHWPGKYLSAQHHAVWRKGDGQLIDVTPQASRSLRGARTSFAIDDTEYPKVGKDPMEFDRIVQMDNEPLVTAVIDAYRISHQKRLDFLKLVPTHPDGSPMDEVRATPELLFADRECTETDREFGRLQELLAARR